MLTWPAVSVFTERTGSNSYAVVMRCGLQHGGRICDEAERRLQRARYGGGTAELGCARRDSNPRPSAPEAAPASDHQRWTLSFQSLTRVARWPAPASDGPVVTTVVTAG